MKRNYFTKEEIILCTYIARFGRNNFDENEIFKLKHRSVSSIKMKVQNIAAMLNEEGYKISGEVSKLSGKTTGEKGRRTNWDIVKTFSNISKIEFISVCQSIVKIL